MTELEKLINEAAKACVNSYQMPFDKHYEDCKEYFKDGVTWTLKHHPDVVKTKAALDKVVAVLECLVDECRFENPNAIIAEQALEEIKQLLGNE